MHDSPTPRPRRFRRGIARLEYGLIAALILVAAVGGLTKVTMGLLACATGALLTAAMHDVAVRTVPNVVVGSLAICGAVLATLQHRLPASLLVASVLLVAAAALWLRGYMGGADAKLLGAAGLLLAPGSVPAMLLATALAGGVLSLPYLPGPLLFGRPAPGRPASVAARLLRCERWRLHRRGPLPYAVAIAAGTLFVLLHGA